MLRTTLLRNPSLLATWQRIRSWTWAAVLAKVALWGAAFVALAHIGAGSVARVLGILPSAPMTAVSSPHAIAAELDALSAPDTPGPFAAADEHGCRRRRDAGAPSDAGATDRSPPAVTHDGRVILNVAAAADLTRLPGIGPKRAQAIVELRGKLGRFRRIADLLRVRGIGRRSLNRIRPHVVLDPPD